MHVGAVPCIRLQMKRDKSTEVFHSTPLRNACDRNVGFANVTGEMLSPIPDSKKIQNIQSDHNYSSELNETESGDRVIESNELDVKNKSMSTDYPEEFMVENNETINSEADAGLFSNHLQFQGNDIMIKNETKATEATQKPKSLVSYEETDENKSSPKQEDGAEKSENSLELNVTTCADDDEKLEDGQKILSEQDISTTDRDRTIDPDETVDPNEDEVGKKEADQQSMNNTEKGDKQTESENVIGSSQEIVQPMRMRLALRGPKACTSKVTVRIRDLNIDLATPLEKNQVFTIQTDDKTKDTSIVQYCCNKCQQRLHTPDGYETHMFHAHRIRNIEKYPPTIIKKSYKSPESLHLDTENSISADNADNKDESAKDAASMSAENARGGIDHPDIPDEEPENENYMQGEKKKTNEKDNTASDEMNQSSKSAAKDSTDTANNSYLGASDSKPLLSLKNWSMTMYQKQEPTVQCPECPVKLFYKSGLKHHYKTHVRQ